MMLQACETHVGGIVQRRVVMHHVADVREIESLITRGFEDREVRIVRELLVNRVKDRSSRGMSGVPRV